MRRFAALLLCSPVLASAQTPSAALAAQWNTICSTAPDYSDLYDRCHETLISPDPNVNLVAAQGQRLEEIPGQVRVANRDQTPLPGMVRIELSPGGATAWLREQPGGGLSLSLDETLSAEWSVFASAEVGRISRSISRNEAAFKADATSLTAGADWRPAAGWQFGAGLNHARESLDYRASASSVDTRFSGLLLFGSREIGSAWLLHGYAGQLQGDYRLLRDIEYRIAQPGGEMTFRTRATAHPDARRRLAGIALDRAWSRGAWSGSVEAGNDWTQTRIDAYREAGGNGIALSVPGRETRTHRGRVDARFDRVASFDWGVWQGSAGFGWRREFGVGRRQLTVTLSEDVMANPVRFDTEDADASWGELSLASSFIFAGGHSAFIEYRQRFAHAFLDERILSLGWRYELP